jgi:DNA polymerase III delta prime subunit
MKFYETHYEDYYHSVEKSNFHPELNEIYTRFPKSISDLENLIFYGPSGSGKYSQMLYLLKRYSPSQLKYEKKITALTEKQNYTYKISDIHYEVDMSLLGCNSKILWHEIFTQVVDIVSMKTEKYGIIVCKNFHSIHNELLDIFYSYIQQYPGVKGALGNPIQIRFILITEHMSFIPNNIVNRCLLLNVPRPSKLCLQNAMGISKTHFNREKMNNILEQIQVKDIVNNKELYSFALLNSIDDLPKDHFNIICDKIIEDMEKSQHTICMASFRDSLYDILIYNLDAYECIWYIFSYFIKTDSIKEEQIDSLLEQLYIFYRQYGNNYRAIFHLENAVFAILCAMKTSETV